MMPIPVASKGQSELHDLKNGQGSDRTGAEISICGSEITSLDGIGIRRKANARNDRPERLSEKKEQTIKQNSTSQSNDSTEISTYVGFAQTAGHPAGTSFDVVAIFL
jgi:hypothetical protein